MTTFTDRYETAMIAGATEYADVTTALTRLFGGPAYFTQTGGMNAALVLQLEGAYVMIGDAEDALSWSRAEQRGWGCVVYPGAYETDEGGADYLALADNEGTETYPDPDGDAVYDNSPETLLLLVQRALFEAGTRH